MRQTTMKLIGREKDMPNGLTRFLRGHEDCPRALEIERDEDLITVICRGCESSFSFVTAAPPSEPTEVDRALRQLASENGAGEVPAMDAKPEPSEDRTMVEPPEAALASENGEPPIVKAVKLARRWDRSSSSSPNSAEEALPASEPARLRPPGPLARRRRRKASTAPLRWSARAGRQIDEAARSLGRRRRPIALTALALTGAYVLVALGTGGDPTSSDTGTPVGGPDLPLQAAGTEAPATGADGRYELALPPGWTRETTERGSLALSSADEQAAVLIRTRSSPVAGVGELADQAARLLAERTNPAAVSRIPSRSEGELLAVAKVSDEGQVSTAYIAEAAGVQYLLFSSRTVDASALVRLEQRELIRSFHSQPAG